MNFKIEKLKYKKLPLKEIIRKSAIFYKIINKRRSIREFDKQKINIEIIENAAHWLHADNPEAFYTKVITFIS